MSHNVVKTSLLWEFPMCAYIINRFVKMLNQKGKVMFRSPVDMTVGILSTSNIAMQNPLLIFCLGRNSVVYLITQATSCKTMSVAALFPLAKTNNKKKTLANYVPCQMLVHLRKCLNKSLATAQQCIVL